MKKDIWVYIEHTEGSISSVSMELLKEALRLRDAMQEPGQVAAVLIGFGVEDLIQEVQKYGAQRVYVAADDKLANYNPDYYGRVLEKAILEYDPHIFLMGATILGTQLAPLIAAKVKTGVAAHCIELKLDEQDNLVAVVPAFGGKVLGDILCPMHRPQMATIKPGILGKPSLSPENGEIIKINTEFLKEITSKLTLLNICREETKGVPLEEAEIVICGGWGIGEQERWELLEKIADRLGGAVACTRPPIDEGWAAGEQMMVGTSGKSIRPKIYIGFGISGATHHICGMKDAGLIISINKDAGAEIFKVSDYGIIGDVKDIIPLLAEAIGVK
ncbi:MAG: electron transfer flavoprotein subunit alpha/FixB family protein [Bacillota bacterium]